jgi:spermidine/putrescine-binding protein
VAARFAASDRRALIEELSRVGQSMVLRYWWMSATAIAPSHLTFYNQFPLVQQLLLSKQCSLGIAPIGLFTSLRKEAPIRVVWEQALLVANTCVTGAKSPHKDAAYALAHWSTDPKREAEFVRLSGYGPGNAATFGELKKSELAWVPNSPQNVKRAIRNDPAALARQYTEYVKAYNNWVTG